MMDDSSELHAGLEALELLAMRYVHPQLEGADIGAADGEESLMFQASGEERDSASGGSESLDEPASVRVRSAVGVAPVPAAWAVLRTTTAAPGSADADCSIGSPGAKAGSNGEKRAMLLLDSIASEPLLSELRANCSSGVNATLASISITAAPHTSSSASASAEDNATPVTPSRLPKLRKRLSSSGDFCLPRRRLTSMSSILSTSYSEASDAPSPWAAADAVLLSPCGAARALAERMGEMGLPALPQGELLARLRLAHWNADQALLEVVGAE